LRLAVGEEGPPGLGRRGAALRDQPGDGAFADLDAELQERTVDSGGAPQGFAAAIRVTRPLIAALLGGRPRMGRPGGVAQGSRKRRRPHRSPVSGATITRVSRHPVQTLDSTTQIR
jgi:hypothetical protein